MATPKIENPVRLDPFQEIVDCHFGPSPLSFEYVIFRTYGQPDVTTNTVEYFDEGGNPSHLNEGTIPNGTTAFFTYRAGTFVVKQHEDFLYLEDGWEFRGGYNSKGETPPDGTFDPDKLSVSLDPMFPVVFTSPGYVVENRLFDRGVPIDANGSYSLVPVASGATINDLPGEAIGNLGETYNGWFAEGSPALKFLATLGESDIKFWDNDASGWQDYKTVYATYDPDNLTGVVFTEVAARTMGATVTYDGKPFDIIGCHVVGGYTQGFSADDTQIRFEFLAKRRRNTTP